MKRRTIATFDASPPPNEYPTGKLKNKKQSQLSMMSPKDSIASFGLYSRSPEDTLNIDGQHSMNMRKHTKILEHELGKLEARLVQIQDPKYPVELKRKLAEYMNLITEKTKLQKSLAIEKAKQERRLDKIIQKGEPEGMKQVAIQT